MPFGPLSAAEVVVVKAEIRAIRARIQQMDKDSHEIDEAEEDIRFWGCALRNENPYGPGSFALCGERERMPRLA